MLSSKTTTCTMIPLPTMDVPFSRVAMDLIGPLPQIRSGNRYVLVLCDYAMRYPEAAPLKNIDAETVAEELIHIFSRMGLPEDILIREPIFIPSSCRSSTDFCMSEPFEPAHITLRQMGWLEGSTRP